MIRVWKDKISASSKAVFLDVLNILHVKRELIIGTYHLTLQLDGGYFLLEKSGENVHCAV